MTGRSGMNADELNKINTTALAYMGDAVYEQAVREMLIRREAAGGGGFHVNDLNRQATGYVKAAAQAGIIRAIFHDLTEQEQNLVKRARNRKSATKAKNADPVTYKWATAFEALVGYLYLSGEKERLSEIFAKAADIIEKAEK